MNIELKVGDKAPEFSMNSYSQESGEQIINSQDLLGNNYILAFYPKDSTPGCTKEMCAFRDDYEAFANLNIQVFGVSNDSIKSHTNFATKQNLGKIILLSTKDTDVLDNYGTNGLLFKKRTLFIINKKGIIAHIIQGMPKNQELLEFIKTL